MDCWGYGADGELGDGSTSNSDVPVAVEGVGGVGLLSEVANVTTGDGDGSTCALLASGGVDCWGAGFGGDLGDGTTGDSNVPVAVEGVGGAGLLDGVHGVSPADGGYCATINSGGVDCWGYGADGELGEGSTANSNVPVAVEGVGGTDLLEGVLSLTSGGGDATTCALLTSGEVDCWGGGEALGGGSTDNSDVPVSVEGAGGIGLLNGVAGLTSANGVNGYCALLTSGGVDCWGYGIYGGLGNGQLYPDSPFGSDVPVVVEGVGGSGTLSGMIGLTGGGTSYCGIQTTGAVDCWGQGDVGELGEGSTADSDVPVGVLGV